MISRSKSQVKRKTILKVVYLKKLKGLLESNAYWGFCNFVSSENKIKKNFLLDLNSNYLLNGVFFFKVRSSYLVKLLVVLGIDFSKLKDVMHLLSGAFVMLVTNNILNVVSFWFKEYSETKLVVYAWKINSQFFSSNIFLDKFLLNQMFFYRRILLFVLRNNVRFLVLLNKKYNS